MAFRTRWRQLSCWLHNLIFHILCFGDEEIVNFSINIVSNETTANVVLYALSWLKCLSKKLTEWLNTCSKKLNRLKIKSRKFYRIRLFYAFKSSDHNNNKRFHWNRALNNFLEISFIFFWLLRLLRIFLKLLKLTAQSIKKSMKKDKKDFRSFVCINNNKYFLKTS